jgi:phosphoenolpyruvate mutase
MSGSKEQKTVYVGMTADIMHPGLINIIRVAREYGDVIVGLLTDKAIAIYKRLPYLNFDQRRETVENIKGVVKVVPQDDWDYSSVLIEHKPDYMIHGDDWCSGSQRIYRERAFAVMAEWGGEIIEIPYTKGISSSALSESARGIGTTPDIRRRTLRRLLDVKPLVRVLEVHNPISALIAEKAFDVKADQRSEFDAVWASSLTTSVALGKPDIEAVDHTQRISLINDIFEVTTKPMIYDGDTGGLIEHMHFTVRALERMGVSAVIFEDKMGLKKNSLFGTDVEQHQCTPEFFSEKIQAAQSAKVTDDFMIISRIESLILDKSVDDALLRAFAYTEAGTDGIMIHSRQKSPDEVFEFCNRFRKGGGHLPIVVVPSSYSATYEQDLQDAGVNVVIYANHMLRAAYPAMWKVAHTILKNKRAEEADQLCMSIKDILDLIPEAR